MSTFGDGADTEPFTESAADKALSEKYKRVRSLVKSRGLDTFKAEELPHLLRLMDSSVPDEDDRELMKSLEYFENYEEDDDPSTPSSTTVQESV